MNLVKFLEKKMFFLNNLNRNKNSNNVLETIKTIFLFQFYLIRPPEMEFYLLKQVIPKQRGAEMTQSSLLLYLCSCPE